MLEAVRHDTDRPESCLAWRRGMKSESLDDPGGDVDASLRGLTVQGEGSLDEALDGYFERIQRVYR